MSQSPQAPPASPCILALGDLHIQPSNLASINVWLASLSSFLSSRKVDAIIIMGDTLHSHETVHTQCLNKMIEYIEICKKYAPVYTLVGNHEFINNQQFLTKNHPLTLIENVIDTPKTIEVKGHQITLCPYVPDGRFLEALSISQDPSRRWQNSRVIFGHQLLDGAKMGAIVAEKVEEWKPEYPLAIMGHIHDKQRPQPNLYYCGSSIQVSFAERDDHTAALIHLDTLEIEEINLYPPRRKTIYADVSEVKELKIEPELNLQIRLSLKGDPEEFKTFKKSLLYTQLSKKCKIVFKNTRLVKHPSFPSQTNFQDILFKMLETVDEKNLFHQVFETSELVFEE
jgi:DNA repair exonuclease SbcCD nuclease subunit